jgi:hypothetical protein
LLLCSNNANKKRQSEGEQKNKYSPCLLGENKTGTKTFYVHHFIIGTAGLGNFFQN